MNLREKLRKYHKRLLAVAPFLAGYAGSWVYVLLRGNYDLFSAPWDLKIAVSFNALFLIIVLLIQCSGYGVDD